MRANHPLDYFSGSPYLVDCNGIEHFGERKDKMIKALFALKNSSINLLLKNRRDTKLHNLKQILQEFISHKNKQKEMSREFKRELEAKPLEERLEIIAKEERICTTGQFEKVKTIMQN